MIEQLEARLQRAIVRRERAERFGTRAEQATARATEQRIRLRLAELQKQAERTRTPSQRIVPRRAGTPKVACPACNLVLRQSEGTPLKAHLTPTDNPKWCPKGARPTPEQRANVGTLKPKHPRGCVRTISGGLPTLGKRR